MVFGVGVDKTQLPVDTLSHEVDLGAVDDGQTVSGQQQLHIFFEQHVHIIRLCLGHQLNDLHIPGAATLFDTEPYRTSTVFLLYLLSEVLDGCGCHIYTEIGINVNGVERLNAHLNHLCLLVH